MPSIPSITQAEEVQKSSPEQAIPLYQGILAAVGTGTYFVSNEQDEHGCRVSGYSEPFRPILTAEGFLMNTIDPKAKNEQESALLKLAQCYRDLQYVSTVHAS